VKQALVPAGENVTFESERTAQKSSTAMGLRLIEDSEVVTQLPWWWNGGTYTRGEDEKQYPDMRMKVSVRMPGSADVEAMHTFDNASEELRRIEKIAKNMVKLSLSEDTDTGNFTIAYKLTLYCFSSDHKHSQNTICEVPFLVEYKGGEWKK